MRDFLLCAAVISAISSPAIAANLTVELLALKPHIGRVVVALYDQAHDFPIPEKRLAFKSFAPDDVTASVVFGDLQPGRYAVVAYQDANSNGKLDKNFLGVPSELYGFSNNAQGRMGPPSFEAAAINVSLDTQVTIALH